MSRFIRAAAALLCLGLGGLGAAHAQQALLSEVRTVASESPPVEKTFEITASGEYELSLTDFLTPAPLNAIRLAVTRDGTVVTTVDAPIASHRFTTTAGTHMVRVVGTPSAAALTGGFAAEIKSVSSGAQVVQVGGSLTRPQPEPAGRGTIAADFTVSAAGTYDVTLADLQLPQSLPTLTLAILARGSSTLLVTLTGASSQSVAMPAGEYQIFVAAQSPTVKAGLFSATVRPAGGGAAVFSQTASIGNVTLLGTATTAAGSHTLTLSDFAFPAALTQQGAAVVRDGAAAAQLNAAGSTTFTATPGDYSVYAFAAATVAAPSSGSYGIEVRPQGGAAVFSAAKSVGGAPGTAATYSFIVDVPSAGSYRARLADFEFPAAFASLGMAAVQGGTLLGSLNAPGSLDLTLNSGQLFLLVLAPPGSLNVGLFGVDVAASGGATLFATTQGVGKLFAARQVTVSTAGRYNVTIEDLEFPAPFSDLTAVVTRGTDTLGSIFASGKFSFDATPGDYIVNFIAQGALLDEDDTSSQQRAGTYRMSVAQAPAAPAVTLSTNPTQVRSGETVQLTWSSERANSCTASNGWSGTKQASGSERSAPITASTTFTITCDGDGGSTTQSVSVALTASTSGGGGGSLEWLTLLMLIAGLASVALRRS